jgi:hypothetical protein
VVRCLAEINEVLTLIRRENPYAELYADLVKRTGAMLDAYPWLAHAEGFELDAALRQVREVADKAVDEFDKVRRLQREAVHRVQDLGAAAMNGSMPFAAPVSPPSAITSPTSPPSASSAANSSPSKKSATSTSPKSRD